MVILMPPNYHIHNGGGIKSSITILLNKNQAEFYFNTLQTTYLTEKVFNLTLQRHL